MRGSIPNLKRVPSINAPQFGRKNSSSILFEIGFLSSASGQKIQSHLTLLKASITLSCKDWHSPIHVWNVSLCWCTVMPSWLKKCSQIMIWYLTGICLGPRFPPLKTRACLSNSVRCLSPSRLVQYFFRNSLLVSQGTSPPAKSRSNMG